MKELVPAVLESRAISFEKKLVDLSHPLRSSAQKLLLVSDFAARQLDALRQLLMTDDCSYLLGREQYFSEISQVALDQPQALFMRGIRLFRNKHFLRLLIMQTAGLVGTEAVMRSWSDCADALILHAIDYAKLALVPRFGLPMDAEGQEVPLQTLAMGKLGGRELNYSSDIDLIFTFSENGHTNGPESIPNLQYFTKLIQMLVQLLQQITVDGFVFRVDLRLRPNGDSSPLVSSFASMETYYQEQGRDWERYAMVKARVICQALRQEPAWFERLIKPFVYRRYVDFSVIESLRSMKALIERELQLNPRLDDIKRGRGGIREIEFIIQNFQLIRGGRLPQLQNQNALAALAVLKEQRLLPRSEALVQAYLFLRQLENALQSLDDKQTHSLPTDPIKQAQIRFAMDFGSWEALLAKLEQYQRIVSHSFGIALGKVEVYEDEKRLLANQLSSLWQGHIEESMAVNLLASLQYDNPDQCYHMIHAFRQSRRCQRLSQAARMRLDRFMPMLLSELQGCKATDTLLLQVMRLLENIIGRSPYLALLTENPLALKELLFWLGNSPFISGLLASQPFLLEVLLNAPQAWKPPGLQQLQAELNEQLSQIDELEEQEERLRQFKLMQWLIAARAEQYGFCSPLSIGQFLADLAQAIVLQVLRLAYEQLLVRYPQLQAIIPDFGVIAYGKLGSREMNYNSDLDLVFLHSVPASEEPLVIRLTQKVVHMLTTRSQSGVLYAVDTRLRPSGSAGLLVSSLDAFISYQKTEAWTWEHQALVKARVLSGNAALHKRFLALKEAILTLPRDKQALQKDIFAMRLKMGKYLEAEAIKHEPGGLLDLEFLIQFLVLGSANPALANHTKTLEQINLLCTQHQLTVEQARVLKRAYKSFHGLLHQATLQGKANAPAALCAEVLQVAEQIYKGSAYKS